MGEISAAAMPLKVTGCVGSAPAVSTNRGLPVPATKVSVATSSPWICEAVILLVKPEHMNDPDKVGDVAVESYLRLTRHLPVEATVGGGTA